jgi:uncharacterized membrane protein YbhN (UPF0104 family)
MTPVCKKWLLATIKLVIVLLVLGFAYHTVVAARAQLAHSPWHWRLGPGWLALSGLLYLLGMLFAGLFWYRVLRDLGQEPGLGESLRAYFIGHLGKYVPGKAMVIILRAGLLSGPRVDPAAAAAAVFVETMTMMAVGTALGAAIIAWLFPAERLLFYSAMGMALISVVPTFPPVFRLAVRLVGLRKWSPMAVENILRLGYRTLLCGWILNVPTWLLIGLSLWAALRGIGLDGLEPLGQLREYICCVSLATVAGILSMIPGGLGARDAALAVLIETLLPQIHGASAAAVSGLALAASPQAVVASVVLRIVVLAAEAICAGVIYPLTFLRADHAVGRDPRL